MKKLFFLIGLWSSFPATPQSVTADLAGTVTDPSGAIVSSASLELIRVDTGSKLRRNTDSNGAYLFVQLQPGNYRMSVSAAGFQSQTISDIELAIGQRARVDVRLSVGLVTQTIEVTALGASLLNAESAAIGQVVEQRTIVELPLSGRNFIQLAQISAGTAPIGIGTSPATSWTGRSDSTLSVAGGRENNVSFLVNGIETRNARFGSAGIRPSIEAIQEFKVQRSTFGAEFGRSSAVINTTLRSGTNSWRATLFEFLRNRELDANNFFNNMTGRDRSPLTQNNFGTAVGGPVVLPRLYNGRNQSFFFFNYEGFRKREGATSTALYPSRAQLAGNLADDSAGTGFLPTSSPICQANRNSRKCVDFVDPSSGLLFPGNVIPASRIDPVVPKVLQYIPLPNVTVPVSTPNFPNFNTFGSPGRRNDFDQYNVRIDQSLSGKDQVYGTFSYAEETMLNPALRPKGGEQFPQADRLVTATWSRIFSPTIINEFRFGYNRSRTFRLAETSYGPDIAREELGLKNTSTNPISFGVPAFSISGFGAVGSLSQAIGALDENFQFTDNLSVIRGKHNLRAGFQISKIKYFQSTNNSGNPALTFDGRYSKATGFGLADFLLGTASQVVGSLGDSDQNLRTSFWGGYLQDDWKVTSRFALNVGLRYEFSRSPRELKNHSFYFNPEQGAMFVAGQGVRPEIVDPDWNNIAPRFGFTYGVSGLKNLVIRGGIGTYYATDNWNEEQFKVVGLPFFAVQTLLGDPQTPNLLLRNMLPAFTASTNLTPRSFDRRNRTPYLNQWSFGVQKSITDDVVLELEYTGSTGQKLPQRRNLNIAALDLSGTIPLARRVPYPQYSQIPLAYNGGWSSYNALTARLERRFARGLHFLGSYSWAHAIDLGSTDDMSVISGQFKKYDKGNSAFDVRQRLITSYVYELPFGHGKRFFRNAGRAADLLIGGWQINGINTFSYGQYRTVTVGVDWLLIGSYAVTSLPDLVGDPSAGRFVPDRYLNPAAFDYPKDASGARIRRPGTAARNEFRMPGLNNWDLGLLKNTGVGERVRTQFRLEIFNAWNHTQLGLPTLTMTSLNFGRIGSTLANERRIQLGLKVLF